MSGKRWLFFPAIFILVLLVAGFNGFFVTPHKASLLRMELRAQHRDFWCWAAATEMVSEYLGRRIRQCESVSYVTGTLYCTETCECETGWGPYFGADVEQMKDNWRHWDFKFKHLAGPLPWSELTQEIARGRKPIFAVWSWVGGGGHALVVAGYAQGVERRFGPPLLRNVRGNYVLYKDPWPPDCETEAGFYSCTEVAGGDEAVCTYEAFVSDGVRVWDNTLHLFIDTLR